MNLSRRQTIVMAATVGLLALAVVALWWHNHASNAERSSPAWLDPEQPPDTINADGIAADVSWAANRCRPMAASCGPNTAGRRLRREYPGSLCESAGSIVRGSVNLSAEL